MPYCIQCGKELNEGARFCFHCGAGVPNAQTTPAQAPLPIPAPTLQTSTTPVSQNSPTDAPKAKKDVGRIIVNILFFAFLSAIALMIIMAILVGTGIIPGSVFNFSKSTAKNIAKSEVTHFWQEWDKDMELVSITYDSIKADELDEDEIAAIIAEEGNWGYTDIDGNEYDSHWDYWEETGYDPYEDTYTIYTIRGDYHVTDNRKQDYEGWYCVTLLHRENAPWRTLETEMELPDELKQYLPD